MEKVRFIRRNGRIIPIMPKKAKMNPERAAAKVLSGAALSGFGAYSGSKSLKKGFSAHRSSAEFRAMSKLAGKGSATQNKFIRKSALAKIRGIKNTNIARTKFGLALGLGSLLISSGVSDAFDPKSSIRDEVSGFGGTALSSIVVGLVGKKFGIKATGLNELFTGFARQGRSFSKAKIDRVARSKYKKTNVRKGTQMRFNI